MFESILVIIGAASLYLLFRVISKANEKDIPSISDEVFLDEFHKLYDSIDPEVIITEREALSQYFNIDRSKISVAWYSAAAI